ncbi:DNA translocase FtsK [Treponema sp.]|uniref:DNA translocase FtsK n=1 Tax=Treponema sp. TaxID=166 RepID=UPI003F04CBC5
MTKKERIAAILTGIVLYSVAALFSIALFLGALDFGFTSEKNLLLITGEMLVSVYGICSVLIPAFFFVAGSFCLSAKWSVQRAFVLLISIVPFFTLVIAERTSTAIAAQDTSPIAFAKIFTLSAIAFLLVALEYLLAVTAASYLEKVMDHKICISPQKIKELLANTIAAAKKNSDTKTEREIPEEIKITEETPEPKIPQENYSDIWSIDADGKIKGKTETQEEPSEDIEPEAEPEPEPEETETEDIIDLFERDSMSLTEEISEAVSPAKFEEESESKAENSQIEYDIDFEEPENYQEQTEDIFEIDEDEETEIQPGEEFSQEEDIEPEFEINESEEYAPFSEEEIPAEQENFTTEFQEDEPPEEAQNFSAEEETFIPQEKKSSPSNLESVFSRMEEDARSQIENLRNSPQETSSQPLEFSDLKSESKTTPPVPAKEKPYGPYKISTDLLTAYNENSYWIIDKETEQAAKSLKETLSEFKIDAEVTGIRKGPVVTMFELLPAPGVKLSKIVTLSDNIALRLAASSVRIVAPIPGKRAVGIEVPNMNRAIVSFRECIEQQRNEWKKMAVPVILGKDIEGETQIMDLVKTPHLLIAGSTGAGKSVCVNSMILSILYKRNPSEVKLILIDPKIVELKLYNGIPHLLTPVITEPKKAMQALQYCLCEMERRYAVLDSMGCRDISNYNRKITEQHIATEKLPYMVIIIDEFADLMATTGKALEGVVARLAAMSRAVGIHLVLATQRPSVDVITGLIKANIPSRIAFMVAAKTDSRIIIDQIGAEKLLGKGDMLYTSSTDPFPVRIQGAFVSDQEVENVVDAVKEWGEPEYIDDEIFVDDEEEEGAEQFSLFGEEGEDPLYEKALDIVVQAGKASASYIQRRLSIGYNRAARLVEEMEERGIVGPANGSKPRELIHIP